MTLAALGWNERWQKHFDSLGIDGVVAARVIGEHRTHFEIVTADATLTAVMTGRLRNAQKQRSDLPGVGDFVAVRPAEGDGPAVIEAVLPRTSALIRKAAGERRPQLLAANVDVVFIVMGLDGDFNLARLQRYLDLVHSSGADAVIVANKVDLAGELDAQLAALAVTAVAAPFHALSARHGDVVGTLARYFDGNRTIGIIGSSGAGKSTITNKLLGRDAQATQAVRDADSRGRHTTTHRQLFVRDRCGAIMDTPGMRELEVWASEDSIAPDFADVEALALDCRFRDCRHGSEPACAVRAAVDVGTLDGGRRAAFIAHATAERQKNRY